MTIRLNLAVKCREAYLPHLLQTWQSLPVLPLSFPASRQIGVVTSDPAGSQRGKGRVCLALPRPFMSAKK